MDTHEVMQTRQSWKQAWRASIPRLQSRTGEQSRDPEVRSAYSPLYAFFLVITMGIPGIKGCEV